MFKAARKRKRQLFYDEPQPNFLLFFFSFFKIFFSFFLFGRSCRFVVFPVILKAAIFAAMLQSGTFAQTL